MLDCEIDRDVQGIFLAGMRRSVAVEVECLESLGRMVLRRM